MSVSRAPDEVYRYSYGLSNALDLLGRTQKIGSADKELIRRFIDHLRAKRVSTGRLAKYAFTLKNLIEHLGVEVGEARRKDIEALSIWLQGQGYQPHTVSDYIFALKYFFKFVRFGNTDRETPFPDEVRWIKATQKLNERKQPDYFTPQEVQALIRAADRIRDKCMLSIAFERGVRPSELLLMNVGDVAFDAKGARIKLRRSKTGERTVRIISTTSLLSRYLESHPLRDDPEAPLWVTTSTNHSNERVSWVGWNRTIKKTAQKAEMNGRRVHHYLLRHGSATEAARFLTDSELKVLYGWSMSSRMPQVYIHLSGRDIDGKLEQIYSGRPVEPAKPEFSPTICVKCHETNAPGLRYCGRCGTPLEEKELANASVDVEMLRVKVDEALKAISQSQFRK